MDINLEQIIYNIAVWAIPVLFAITIHEVAHGWVANKLGDGTARMLGRLSLNPAKHIDPIGTILVPVLLMIFSPIVFGWAKPVPVNMRNFKNPRRDMAIVAIAGPLSNIAMAVLWVGFLYIMQSIVSDPAIGKGLQSMAIAGVLINVVLFTFNLIPIPPLDGGRVLSGLVPAEISDLLDKMEPYGFFIVIGLVYFGAFEPIIMPVIGVFFKLFGLA
jgi:Zn-dependent protease